MPYITPSKESLQKFILSIRGEYDKKPRSQQTRLSIEAIEKL